MVRGTGPCGANFHTLCVPNCTYICMHGTHAQNALVDPQRSTSAAHLGIQSVHILWLNLNINRHTLHKFPMFLY